MTTYFVTRHQGAVEWARGLGINATPVSHLDPASIRKGDTVLGTLPVNIAADICASGAHYFHLSLTIPEDRRGDELTADEMTALGAELVRYHCAQVPAKKGNDDG